MMTKVAVYRNMCRRAVFVILFLLPLLLQAQYRLQIIPVDKDSTFIKQQLRLQTDFRNQVLCTEYVNNLPALLLSKGYPASSVDSIRYDSLSAVMHPVCG